MFRNNDKLNLTLINARDINGNILPFSLKLPLNDTEYKLPENMVAIDVFEYHEGIVNGGYIAFSIYIGKKTTIDALLDNTKVQKMKIINNLKITSFKSSICYQDISQITTIFATLNKQDIVVKNQEQLISVIEQLSNEYANFCNSANNIRTLYKKKI